MRFGRQSITSRNADLSESVFDLNLFAVTLATVEGQADNIVPSTSLCVVVWEVYRGRSRENSLQTAGWETFPRHETTDLHTGLYEGLLDSICCVSILSQRFLHVALPVLFLHTANLVLQTVKHQPPFYAGLAALAAPKAEAVTIPNQDSTGGQAKRGSLPPSTSEASSSSYNMEGTKKMGVSAKRKQQVLAQARKEAGK